MAMYLYAFWESGKFGNICFLVISWLKLGMHIIYIEQNRRLFFNKSSKYTRFYINKAGNTATPVACGWAGAIFEVTPSFGQEQ